MAASLKIDMTGRKYGKLTVLREAEAAITGGKTIPRWECKCECGTVKTIRGLHLRNGLIVSCGCHKNELASQRASKRNLTHGQSNKRVYWIWRSMVQRCINPKNRGFAVYGGRGIKVCRRWLKFENFLQDMGHPPAKLTIERKNTNGNYTKSNCIWASQKEQQRNRRNNRLITIEGQTKTVAEWAELSGKRHDTILYRLNAGWEPTQLLS